MKRFKMTERILEVVEYVSIIEAESVEACKSGEYTVIDELEGICTGEQSLYESREGEPTFEIESADACESEEYTVIEEHKD